MTARIEKTFQVKAPIEKVWALLSDPRSVVQFVPGAKITESLEERTFKGAISVKVGPIVTDYKGDIHVDRLDEDAHEIELAGRGQDVRGKGSASMKMTGKLDALPDGGTEARTVSEINVVGILAQFGGRMIYDVSDVMFKEFTERFKSQLEQPVEGTSAEAATTEPVNAIRLVSSALGRSVRRAFGGSDDSGDKS
ncbi:MAG: SRPBCC family protein [Acidobacteriaceae bacterium]|nr:SRPBCC family protein [Acidobacteriaceae bacterium]